MATTNLNYEAELLNALQLTSDHLDGNPVHVRETLIDRSELTNVSEIRQKLGVSQEVFAGQFGVSLGTVRNWEQGRRYPNGAARILLEVIDEAPELVRGILNKRVSHVET